METDIWRWVRPSWGRLYVLALAAPAFWVVWRLLDRDPAKVVVMLIVGGWLVFIFRTWFWFEKPRFRRP
ncbi:hypothetical protein JIP62_08605 [Brevundimonas vitis]|uniref:Uncharacterized protein n=1 Tax=Brevundimonas vitisensis TaxID=2800818 RepID=A0ABX7BKP9_9CAUL|nr:hypothetical protein [Brevundimonas vitisensis]QQQ17418.1 hypothetical protein JIP62_08605 [Brevundimonas vitisensis]